MALQDADVSHILHPVNEALLAWVGYLVSSHEACHGFPQGFSHKLRGRPTMRAVPFKTKEALPPPCRNQAWWGREGKGWALTSLAFPCTLFWVSAVLLLPC